MRFAALMSGGIDSPAATHLMLRTGAELHILHMDTSPFGEGLNKAIDISRRLEELHPGRVNLYKAPHGRALERIVKKANRKYTCLLCKRVMLMTADSFCKDNSLSGIIMGDSLGQVASQTLPNIAAVSAGIRHPIIRPLIGFDKIDIEKIAKEIGTFEISISGTNTCSAAPRYPITRADIKRLRDEEKKLDMEDLIRDMVSDTEGVDLRQD